MKVIFSFSPLAAIVLLTSLPALGQQQGSPPTDSGFYWRADLGASVLQNNDLTDFGGLTSGNKISYDSGFAVQLAGGYAINKWVATELELGWTWNAINSIEGFWIDDTSFGTVPIMAKLVLQYPIPNTRVVPYLGGGVGGVATVFDTDGMTYAGGPILTGNEADFVFGYQGFAGIRVNLTDQFYLGVAYTFIGSEDSSYSTEESFAYGPEFSLGLGRQKAHLATLSFTMKF